MYGSAGANDSVHEACFFKIYFLKIIFVDLGIPRGHLLWGPPRIVLRVLCPFASFGLASPRFPFWFVFFLVFFSPLLWALFLCVLYYIVKGILAEMLGFGTRGEQEYWAVYF